MFDVLRRAIDELLDFGAVFLVFVFLGIPAGDVVAAIAEAVASPPLSTLDLRLLAGGVAVAGLEATGRRPSALRAFGFWLGYALFVTVIGSVVLLAVGPPSPPVTATLHVLVFAAAASLAFGDGGERLRATVSPLVRRLLRLPPEH